MKLSIRVIVAVVERHPLTGGCGLKQFPAAQPPLTILSPPHGGVWIETGSASCVRVASAVTPSRGGVD